ncbi:dynein regulatory complex protein 9-like [Nymphalis io]|uniref:dynein regulatory complex protein 9-like n=1 Tax=Inachis io TaxID=171585 RepID=UPI00216741FA|nr:dynein regulatory complex protein 9-like [Nymphalis io]
MFLNFSLPYLQAALFANTLEDTITEMRILVQCNNELRVTKTMSDMGLLVALKYGISQPEIKDELESIDYRKINCNEYKINKLDSDRKLIITAITTTYIDLIQTKTYKALENSINTIVNLDNYRVELCNEEEKNKVLRRELNKQIRQQHNHIKSIIYDTDATIDTLRSEVEDANLNAEIRNRYVERWQVARTEQHNQTIYDKEALPTTVIEYYKRRADSEQRVHSEVELLVTISINETLEKIDDWMNKYDKDMENIELKIQLKKNDYQNMLDKRINLEEMIEKHKTMIKEWIQFKGEREKARLYRENMTKSAIIVQAWWRGLLVRRQLGPYKAKKKGGEKKKK